MMVDHPEVFASSLLARAADQVARKLDLHPEDLCLLDQAGLREICAVRRSDLAAVCELVDFFLRTFSAAALCSH